MAGPISLVDTAAEIERASESVSHQASAQLELIARQIRQLQEQAREVIEKAREDLALHQAECRFQKVPGRIYHLYRRWNNTLTFSMLAPEDYGGAPPHEFVGSYRLEPNGAWTPAATLNRADEDRAALWGYLNAPK